MAFIMLFLIPWNRSRAGDGGRQQPPQWWRSWTELLSGPELGSTVKVVSDGPTDHKEMLCRGEKIIRARKVEPYWPCFFHILLFGCSMEMCDQRNNITMCPLCDRTCSYWKMSSACATARASHLFDNPATVFFSVFMALWGKKIHAFMLSF